MIVFQQHRDEVTASLMAAVAAEEKQLRALTRSSRSSSNSSSVNAPETTIDKVTLSPVAAASIAGLPPQTSITVRNMMITNFVNTIFYESE